MTTSVTPQDHPSFKQAAQRAGPRLVRRAISLRFIREILIVIAFCLLTALMTWPYVTRLKDAVSGRNDPYLSAYILWWDYHATFTAPLHLFHPNIFYPYPYALAFSEHGYGIALLFFPLFALGLQPLTVHAIAIFFGFVLSGYGAFRLGRTLTGSYGVAWVAGIIFAFVPYRYDMIGQVMYLFSPWVPLLLEALVLFARARTWKRAAWLGVAFFMSGISTISWFLWSLIPLAAIAAVLLTRYRLWRERDFWRRAAVALAGASIALMPFMLPYVIASRMYGFKRRFDEVRAHSAMPMNWFSADEHSRMWQGLGDKIYEGWKFQMFPGLLPLLLPLAELLSAAPAKMRERANEIVAAHRRWVRPLDVLIVMALALAVLAIGLAGTGGFGRLFVNQITSERALALLWIAIIARCCLAYPGFLRRGESANLIETIRSERRSDVFWIGGFLIVTGFFYSIGWKVTPERALALLLIAIIARLCLAYPGFLRRAEGANLIETIRSERRSDAFWIGVLLTVIGFFYSLGWNFFFYRILYDLMPGFKSIRAPMRGALFAYLGLAILSGLGVRRIAEIVGQRSSRIKPVAVYAVACALLLIDLNGIPFFFIRGDVYPDAVTLRLKQTPMRGGIAYLPFSLDLNHQYTLRAADHRRPIITATSSFNPPYFEQIDKMTNSGPIPTELMDLFEKIPASYLVVENQLIVPERQADYAAFLTAAVSAGRLRFINQFDGHNDLYALTKIEPEARSEASLPRSLNVSEWSSLIEDDPTNLVVRYLSWSQDLYRIHVVTYGHLPRYANFMEDVRTIGRGVIPGFDAQKRQLEINFGEFAQEWTRRADFTKLYGQVDHAQYVDALSRNAGLNLDMTERETMIRGLANGQETRTSILLKIAANPRYVEQENSRSIVLLYYFAYLQRNPDDPPDRDLVGFDFWVQDVERNHDTTKLAGAFNDSLEYHALKNRR